MKHRSHKRSRRLPRRVWLVLIGLVVALIAGSFAVWHIYNNDLHSVSSSQTTQIFTVESGSTVKDIAVDLEKAHLIRSAWAMQLYVHREELGAKLQAGTYALSPSQDTPSIVATLTKGKVATRLVTILPGRRIDQVRADLINSGFTPASVDAALTAGQYADLPVMAFKPANVNTLEGLLWPNSYQKNPDTDPSVIIRESLTETGEHLTPDVQAAFANEGLTTYQGVILASMIEQEVGSGKVAEQAQVAQVFLSRLKAGSTLGSDVTARYGAIAADKAPSLSYDSPYNTLMHKGLPPTPISTISANALTAATHPAATTWLYFVTGDNGTTYFSNTLEEHEAKAQQYCHKLCGR
jgi:UPF0755 protein